MFNKANLSKQLKFFDFRLAIRRSISKGIIACLFGFSTIVIAQTTFNDTTGTSGHDNLVSTDLADAITGGTGSDIMMGLAGDDKFLFEGLGQDGVDTIIGSAGSDVIDGGAHSDTIDGRPGGDILLGRGGHDNIQGSTGNDVIDGVIGSGHFNGGKTS